MENKDVKMPPKTRGPMRGPGRGMMPGEKAKDFKWSIGKLLAYLGNYKIGIIVVMILRRVRPCLTLSVQRFR